MSITGRLRSISAIRVGFDSTFAVALLGSAGCALVAHLAPDRRAVVALLPVAVAWGVVVVARARRPVANHPAAVLLAALLVRLALVGTPPHLSDDLYRYLWEGAALAAGHDPFT